MIRYILILLGLLTVPLFGLASSDEEIRDYVNTNVEELEAAIFAKDIVAIRLELSSNAVVDGVIAWTRSGERIYPPEQEWQHTMDETMEGAALRLSKLAETAKPWSAETADVSSEQVFYCLRREIAVCFLLNVRNMATYLNISSEQVLAAFSKQGKESQSTNLYFITTSFLVLICLGLYLRFNKNQTLQDKAAIESFNLNDVCVFPRQMHATHFERKINLTEKDVKILRYFLEHAGEVVSKDELYDVAWGRDFVQSSRALEQHIINLRKKLDPEKKHSTIIETVHGQGYRFSKSN